MKAEVTMSKRPRTAESRGKLRYLDLNFDGWKESEETNGVLDNGRKPHGGYKGLNKHPMGIHSFTKGADYQHQLLQARQTTEQEQHQSPTWALKVHTLPTHSGESPLLSGRLMSASKHEAINGRLRPETESTRTTRCGTPIVNKKTTYYRPNSTHQYLTATELKDATDCEDVVKYGRPTRTTLLRARHRASSASTSAYEARRQKEQRIAEMKKVSAFCSPEEITPVYSDSEDQSFYSFLMGARYNRAHCLDSKSLVRHGVYMPRNNPLGCFVITDKSELDGSTAPADSPRSDVVQAPRPQTERQQRRPTTAPSYGRKSSARTARTPRTPRTPRQAWGDVTVSLYVTNGAKQTLTFSKDGPCKFEARLPVVHGTSLSKLQRFKEPPTPLEDPSAAAATEAGLQPPPSPISARGDFSLPAAPNSLDLHPLPQHPAHPTHPDPTDIDAIDQVSKENTITPELEVKDDNTKNENEPKENGGEGNVTTTTTTQEVEAKETRGGEGAEEDDIVSGQERLKEGEEEKETAEARGDLQGEESAVELKDGEKQEEEEEKEVAGGKDEEKVEEKSTTEDNLTTTQLPDDETTPADDVTPPVIESTQQREADSERKQSDTAPSEQKPATQEPNEKEADEKKDEDNVSFFVTEQGGDDDLTNEAQTELSTNAVTENEGDNSPQVDQSSDSKSHAEEDAVSSTSSKKSLTKRVSFKIPPAEDSNPGPDVIADDDENIDHDVEDEDNVAQNQAGSGAAEVTDSDLDDLGQGQGEGEEPLKVIVTHIEKSLGAPVSRENEGEVIAKHP